MVLVNVDIEATEQKMQKKKKKHRTIDYAHQNDLFLLDIMNYVKLNCYENSLSTLCWFFVFGELFLDFDPLYRGGGGWGCEVSCGGHHQQRGKTTTGSALDGAILDFIQILSYLVHNMSRSQLYLGFGHFGWLPFLLGQQQFGKFMVKLYFICWNYSLSSGWHIIAA